MPDANVPDCRVVVDGVDITPRLREPIETGRVRLIGLALSERRDGDADQLEIAIDDSDGRMALPRVGAKVALSLGWKRGADVSAGLVDKGRFIVDEITHEGPPDVITVRARSADLAGDLAKRREKSWHASTLGAVVRDIAGRNGLTPRCAPNLAALAVDVTQSRESDMALLRRLGREHDAVATIKGGALLFAAIGAGITAGGATIPSATIRRRDGDRHTWSIAKREEADGVEASWHDVDAAEKKKVQVGGDGRRRKLARVYASEAAAKAAAQAEQKRLGRLPVKLGLGLGFGRPDLYPEVRVAVSGFKPQIDATRWLIVAATHTLSDRGFMTSLELETASQELHKDTH